MFFARSPMEAAARWTASFAALAAVVLLYHRWLHGNATTVAITLLLLVLLLSATWGLRYAAAVAIVATACFNYFFLPPIGTFTISDPQNWLSLFLFLAASVIASRLSLRARKQAAEADMRKAELEQLVRLSTLILQMDDVSRLVRGIPRMVMEATGAAGAEICLVENGPAFSDGECRRNVIELPLRSGVRERGILRIAGTNLSESSSIALAALISLAIDHADALDRLAREEAAKERERLRTLLTDSITHELRTPLTAIKGAVTTLLSGMLPQNDAHELLDVIDEEADRLNSLVTEAVQVARLDAHEMQLDQRDVSIAELVANALRGCSWVREEHEVAVSVPVGLDARCDPDVLVRALIVLIENAAKYSAPGSPVRIDASSIDGGAVEVSVRDEGLGIRPADQSLIFERFYRVPTPGRKVSGTGMGLAICRAIVEAHCGSTSVESALGQGSTFTITLPRAS